MPNKIWLTNLTIVRDSKTQINSRYDLPMTTVLQLVVFWMLEWSFFAENGCKGEEDEFDVDPERSFSDVLHPKIHFFIPHLFEVDLVGIIALEQ